MAIWWKRLGLQDGLLDSEASRFIKAHGAQAIEVARKTARSARNKRDLRQARHYSRVALRIADLSKLKTALDVATQAPADGRHLSGAQDSAVIIAGGAAVAEQSAD